LGGEVKKCLCLVSGNGSLTHFKSIGEWPELAQAARTQDNHKQRKNLSGQRGWEEREKKTGGAASIKLNWTEVLICNHITKVEKRNQKQRRRRKKGGQVPKRKDDVNISDRCE